MQLYDAGELHFLDSRFVVTIPKTLTSSVFCDARRLAFTCPESRTPGIARAPMDQDPRSSAWVSGMPSRGWL
jgi:hypothetical protein